MKTPESIKSIGSNVAEKTKRLIFDGEEFNECIEFWQNQGRVDSDDVDKAKASLESREVGELLKLFTKVEATLYPFKFAAYAVIGYGALQSDSVGEGALNGTKLYIAKTFIEMITLRLPIATFYSYGKELPQRKSILTKEALVPWVGRFAPIYELMKDHPEFVKLFWAYQKAKRIHRKNNNETNPNLEAERNAVLKKINQVIN